MKKVICCIGSFLLLATTLFGQDKIGYANPDAVLATMKELKQVDSLVSIFQNELQADYLSKNTELEKLFESYNRDSSKFTNVTKVAKQKVLQNKLAELQATQKKYDELIKAENEKLLQPLQQKIVKAIQDVAKENSYDIVLYSTAAVELNNGADITEKVKKKLGTIK